MSSSLFKYRLAAISPVIFAGLGVGCLRWLPGSTVAPVVLLLAAAGAGLTMQRIYHVAQQRSQRERTATFLGFLERLAHITFVLNAEERIAYISPGATRFGIDPATMVGQSWRKAILPCNLPLVESLLGSIGKDVPDAAGPRLLELTLRRGDQRFCDVTAFRFPADPDVHTVVLLYDVTDRQVVRDSMADIDRMAAVAHLSAAVAHNFNNILAGIMLNAGLLADAEGEERLVLSERVIASAERGAALCRNLVTFAQRETPTLGQVPVRPLLSDLMLLFETEAKRHSVTATWDADPALTVWGDRNHIQQILLNLLFNAREAVGTDGLVRITASACAEEVRITVSNSGPPLPAAHLPLIFLPFFTTKDDHPHGHGMGLAVCLNLARGMGGTITVKSAPGGETTFTLVLPSIDAP